MKVKRIKKEKEFKPFKVELTFQDEQEVSRLISLLGATEIIWEYHSPSCYPEFDELKEELQKAIEL